MSDMMPRGGMPPGGGMPSGPPMGGGGGMGKSSMLNPMDVAGKIATGGLSKGMTVGQFLQKNFGISPNDPMEKFVQVMKQQTQNATTPGKLGMGQKPPMPGGRPQGGPPMGGRPMAGPPSGGASPRPQGGPPSLDGLMNKL